MSTAELLRRAQEALAAHNVSSDEFIDKVAAYSTAFEAWRATNSDILKGEKPPQDEAEFRALAGAHAKLVDHLTALKARTGKDLGDLRKKGKGIMAYTDILPKRISISGTRKG